MSLGSRNGLNLGVRARGLMGVCDRAHRVSDYAVAGLTYCVERPRLPAASSPLHNVRGRPVHSLRFGHSLADEAAIGLMIRKRRPVMVCGVIRTKRGLAPRCHGASGKAASLSNSSIR